MELNPASPFISKIALSYEQITPVFKHETPVDDLMKLVIEFQNSWNDEFSKIPNLSDRELFASEIIGLTQAIHQTIYKLSTQGITHSEIFQQVKTSLEQAERKLTHTLSQFKVDDDSFRKASNEFDHQVSSAESDFSSFAPPNLRGNRQRTRPSSVTEKIPEKTKEQRIEDDIKRVRDLRAKDPLWALKKSMVEESIYAPRTLGAIIDVIGHAFMKVFDLIREGSRYNSELESIVLAELHNPNPGPGNLIQRVDAIMKQQKISEDFWIEQHVTQPLQNSRFVQSFNRIAEQTALQLDREYLIAQVDTKQFFDDSFNIIIASVPIPSAATVGNLVKKPLQMAFRGTRLTRTAPKIPAVPVSQEMKPLLLEGPAHAPRSICEAMPISKEFSSPKISDVLAQRNVTHKEAGFSPKLFENPKYQHRARMTLLPDRVKINLDWIKLPRGEFSLENYKSHMVDLARKHKVEVVEIEAIFTNPKFCEKWKTAFGSNLVENRAIGGVGKRKREYCVFEFPVPQSNTVQKVSKLNSTEIAIPAKPPRTQREMIKLFKDIGYEVVEGGKGSHVKLKRKDSPMIIIPQNLSRRIAIKIFKDYKKIVKADQAKLAGLRTTAFKSSVIAPIVALSAQTDFGIENSHLIITGVAATALGFMLLKSRLKPFRSSSKKMETVFKSFPTPINQNIAASYVPNFTLVSPVQTTLSSLKKISSANKKKLVPLSNGHYYYNGPIVNYKIAIRGDGSHVVFVGFIGHQSAIFKSIGPEGWRGGVKLVKTIETNSKTNLVFKSLMRMQKITRAGGSNHLQLEFVAANKKILRVLYKRYKYLGRDSHNSFGEKFSRGVHKFEINLNKVKK